MGCSCGCDSCQGGYDHLNPTRVLPGQATAPAVMSGAVPEPVSYYPVPFAYGELARTDPLVRFVDEAHRVQVPQTEAQEAGAHEWGSAGDLISSQRIHAFDDPYAAVHRRRLARASGFGACFMPLEFALFAGQTR